MQAELAYLLSPNKDLWSCPSCMNSIKMTFLTLEAKRKRMWATSVQGSMFWGEVRREKLGGDDEVFFFPSPLLCVVFVD